jgi:hypoxanthine-guanine phosphoribosyltransferase
MDHSVHPDIERVLIDEATIQRRVDELASQINRDYAELDRLRWWAS